MADLAGQRVLQRSLFAHLSRNVHHCEGKADHRTGLGMRLRWGTMLTSLRFYLFFCSVFLEWRKVQAYMYCRGGTECLSRTPDSQSLRASFCSYYSPFHPHNITLCSQLWQDVQGRIWNQTLSWAWIQPCSNHFSSRSCEEKSECTSRDEVGSNKQDAANLTHV